MVTWEKKFKFRKFSKNNSDWLTNQSSILKIGFSFRTILKFKIKFQFQSSKMEKKYLLFKVPRPRLVLRHKVAVVIVVACLSVQKIFQPIRINLRKRKKSKGKFWIPQMDFRSDPEIHGMWASRDRSVRDLVRGSLVKPFILETKLIMWLKSDIVIR